MFPNPFCALRTRVAPAQFRQARRRGRARDTVVVYAYANNTVPRIFAAILSVPVGVIQVFPQHGTVPSRIRGPRHKMACFL